MKCQVFLREKAGLKPHYFRNGLTITSPKATRSVVIDVFIDELDLVSLRFKTVPEDTGCPPYHPVTLLMIYIYGYLNRVQSLRLLWQENQSFNSEGKASICVLPLHW